MAILLALAVAAVAAYMVSMRFVRSFGAASGFGPEWWRGPATETTCNHGWDDLQIQNTIGSGRSGLRIVANCYRCGTTVNAGWVLGRPSVLEAIVAFFDAHPQAAYPERLQQLRDAVEAHFAQNHPWRERLRRLRVTRGTLTGGRRAG